MIERVLLVAGRELGATLLTRAFIIMVLTPIIALLMVPLVIFPFMLLVDLTGYQAEAPVIPQVQVHDETGWVAPALAERLEDRWEVVALEELPDDPGGTLWGSDAQARVVLGSDAVAEGTYTAYFRGAGGHGRRVNTEPLVTALDRLLGEARLVEAGLTREAIDDAQNIDAQINFVEVKPRDFTEIFAQVSGYVVPVAVLFLMFAALSMAGQGLLTSTLEEKSTRVAEVLLGAVSPVELLTGKVLGQLGVSVIFALFWGGPSLLALGWFGSYFLGPFTLLYLTAFICIASLSWAAVMGGIGSAVNDLTEAQHILAPLFMVMMVFFLPAGFAIPTPDSTVIVVSSMLPPIAPAVMAVRLTSAVPPPHWQVWIALITSSAFAVGLLWAAGRLFRIGLLLRGSPPNLRTMMKWVLTS